MSDFRLKVFVSVARELSFTKASKVLHISQPAISKHIQELESIYGVGLFERKGSGVVLTKAGERLLFLSENIIEKYKEVELEMQLFKGSVAGELKLGASSTIAQYVIAEILAKFVARYPEVKVNLTSGNSEQIELALSERRVDIGLVEGVSKKREFHYEHFANDELVLVTAGGNRVAQEIEKETIKKLPLVLRESGSGTLEVLLESLGKHNIKFSDLNIVVQLGSTESIKQFLLNSKTFAFVSIVSVLNELVNNKLKIVDVKDLDIRREFSFVSKIGESNDIVTRFVEFANLCYNKKL